MSDQSTDGIEHPGEVFDGVWWKCPRCPGGYVSSRDPHLLAEKTDEHLQEHHGITLEEYQEQDGFERSVDTDIDREDSS